MAENRQFFSRACDVRVTGDLAMFEHKFVVAAALCVLLAGCGPSTQYQPATGAAQTQTADAAYWDCVGQSWGHALGTPAAWIPVPVAQDVSAADTMAFVHACMAQKGWAKR